MHGGRRLLGLVAAMAVVVACAALADPAVATTFSNPGSIALRDPNFGGNPNCSNPPVLCNATAATYPSNIAVSGLSGTIRNVTLSLNNVSYGFSQDIDALLVGPGGQSLIVVAAVGPTGDASEAASNSTLTISDAGALPSDLTPWGSASTFKPANFGSYGLGNAVNGHSETYTSPAPAAPWGDPGQLGMNATLASIFNGTDPNGTWNLYVITTSPGDGTGAIAGGWTLNVTTAAAVAATTTTLTSDNNPSFTSAPGDSVAFSATVHKTSDNSNVDVGTVTFADGGTPIPGCVGISTSSSGARCPTTFSTEGTHAITATYDGTSTFGTSSDALSQVVNNHTVAPPSLSKSFGAVSVPLNGSTELILTVTNPNATVSLSGVGYTDTLPPGLVVATNNLLSQSCGGSISAAPGSSLVSLSGATLAASASCTISLAVTGTSAGAKVNTTSVVSSNEGGSGAPATATLTVLAPPVISKAFAPSSIQLNGTSTLTFTLSNPNPSDELDGVGLTDTFPAGLVVATPSGATSTCANFNGTIGSGGVSATGIVLPPGVSCTFAVNVTGTTSGTKNNSVTVTSTNGGTGNTATASLEVAGAVQIGKAFGASSVPLGGSTSLGFTVTNPAANGPETGIGFTDTLPTGLVVATPSNLSGSCNGGAITATAGASSVRLSGAVLAAGGSCTFTLTVTGTSAGVKNNSVTVSSTEGGTGNTSNASLTVIAPPSLTKAFGAATIPLNSATTLTFAATNPNATSSLSGVGFTDTLPAGLVVATPNGLTGSCGGGTITATAGSSSVSLSGATLGAGASCTFAVNVTGTSPGSKLNTTSAVSSVEGGSGGGASATLVVVSPPSLAKTFGSSAIALNGTTTLSFVVMNANVSTALTGVGFTDALPAGLVVATPNGLTGSCGGGTITATAGSTNVSLSGGSVAAASTCSFSVNVTGTTAGTKVNTTSTISSTEGGTGATATATVSVAGAPQIAKSFGAATVAVGASTSLSFTVTNPAGNGTETGIAFTDALPGGLVVATPNGITGTCGGGALTATAGATSVGLSGATLADGASCAFAVNVTGTSAGVKNNSVTVSSTEGGTGNTASASLTVIAAPSLTKTFGAASVPTGGTTSLTFTATNPNATVGLTGVGFSDTLPAGLTVANPNGLTGSCGGGTITATAGSGTVSLSGGQLAAAGACTFAVNVTGTAAGTKVNTTSAISSTEGGAGLAASANLTVVGPPQIGKSFGAGAVALNGSTSLSFTINNPNSAASLTGVAFTDTLPAGLVVATPNGLTGSCGGGTITATAGSGTVSLTGATLPASGSCTFSVNVTATTVGVKSNSVTVSSTNGGTGNTATASVTTAMPPTITKTFGAPTIPQGGQTSLSFTIANPAGNIGLTGIAFTDTLPAGMTVATPSGLSGSCGGGTITATAGSGSVSLAGASLAGGATCTFAVNVTATTVGVENNAVTASATESGPGNTSLASLTVVGPPTITKTFGGPTVPLGGQTSLSFTLGNPAGNVTLTGVGFTDNLPAGLVVATPAGVTGSCGGGTITATAGSGTVSLSGATLAAGAGCTFSVNVTGTAAGLQKNSVTASSGNGGSGAKSLASVTVVAPPTIAKAFGASTIPFGSSTSLSFTVANANADATLTGVGFTDALPAGLVVATPNGLTGSCGGGTVTATAGSAAISLSGATVAAGGSCTIAVNVTAAALGAQHNTTSAVSSTEGGSGAPATATVTVTKAPTTTTLVATPPSAAFGAPITFTATVAPAQANGSGVGPTGTVSFFVDGQSTVAATVALGAGGQASYTASGLGAGSHTVVAVYNGDQNFLGSTSSPGATVAVTCATTVSGTRSGALILGPGVTCIAAGAHVTGSVIVHAGAAVDIEGATIDGPIDATDGPSAFRLCGSNVGGSVSVAGATGFVLVGDPGDDGCPSNTIHGSLSLKNNAHGVEAIGNRVSGAILTSGNSGTGPFAEDTGPDISGNGP